MACPAPSVSTIPMVWDRTNVYNLALCAQCHAGGSNAYAGVHAPDVVGNIRVDQAWGIFQISADAHEVNGSYNVLKRPAPPPARPALPARPRPDCRKSQAIPTPNGAAR